MGELYVADAHAFAYYLVDRLPRKADAIFRDAELMRCEVVIPSIAIADLIHIFEKTETKNRVWEMFEKIDAYPSFSICPLDEELLKIIPGVELAELHDRIVVGTCKLLGAKGLITKDIVIQRSGLVKTIW